MRTTDARPANEPPVVGHNRTKVTLACDACRKRRVACASPILSTYNPSLADDDLGEMHWRLTVLILLGEWGGLCI